MTSDSIGELLERAAASVTPTEPDPAATMVSLGRRSVRRRRAWGAAGAVAAAVAAVVAVPLALSSPERFDSAQPKGTTVEYGGLKVVVPQGWRTSRSAQFDACNAEEHTVYLAEQWDFRAGPQSGGTCKSEGKVWMAVTLNGVGQPLSPNLLMVKDEQVIDVEQSDRLPSVWTYVALDNGTPHPAAFISADEAGRQKLLERITWPAGPPAPPSGGLALPDRPTSIVADGPPPSNFMAVVDDAKTVARIRGKLAELRDPVPAGEACILRKPGSVGFSLDADKDGVLIVVGDASCPQAISTGGGRVQVPAGLGQELYDLIVAKSIK
ncbi:hypothetical protein DMB66_20745 [Actinoplanes sp. ATCC 53533]|uniref:hypothetical protein n=1 Tax=Actinoplanes sp. ATCC 53533 TaxID=1288362 RepID=UPI000F7A72FE|nr:hypothetical protein [Actinoplanes sp. ATCC 53533]RSM64329.1 hypothetical protein DMB66_20745 [Actinoplanes sp. ATCC 53533]